MSATGPVGASTASLRSYVRSNMRDCEEHPADGPIDPDRKLGGTGYRSRQHQREDHAGPGERQDHNADGDPDFM